MYVVDPISWARFQANLKQYVAFSKKDISDILDRKGNDLRIAIGKMFRRFRWKGKHPAWREMLRRSKAGKGTLVRQRYLSAHLKPPATSITGKPLTTWQKLVWQEVARRQRGIGVLGATFFSKRWRTRRGGERYLTTNKSRALGTLAMVEKTPGSFTLTGFTPGLAKVDAKRGIVRRAVNVVNRDMEKYLKRKTEESLRKAFKNG